MDFGLEMISGGDRAVQYFGRPEWKSVHHLSEPIVQLTEQAGKVVERSTEP